MNPPVHIILNPASGTGKGRKLRSEIERELARRGVTMTVVETESRGHAVELARAAALNGVGKVIAAGGDGTVHEVVNGLLQARLAGARHIPALGIIPIGTGNDFIKSVNGGTDRNLAYQIIAHGVVRYFDLGRVVWNGGAEYFMNGVGTGIDVEVLRQITKYRRLPGVVSYLLGLFKALLRFRPIPVRLRIDGEDWKERVMIVAVGNGFCLGGGFRLFPHARADDGHLDVCVVERVNLIDIMELLPRILVGRHPGHRRVLMRPAEAVEIVVESDRPVAFQVDGELREPESADRLEIEIVRAVLPVLTGGPLHASISELQPIWAGRPAPQALV